jgi:hypothetical protein
MRYWLSMKAKDRGEAKAANPRAVGNGRKAAFRSGNLPAI